MIDEPQPVDVGLILAAGEYPQLSSELRERILQAAEHSCSRRSLTRRVLRVVCVLAIVVCMSGWLRTLPTPASVAASQVSADNQHSQPLDSTALNEPGASSQALVTIGECEWRFVDAFSQVRRELSNPIDVLRTPALVRAIDSAGRIQYVQQRMRRTP